VIDSSDKIKLALTIQTRDQFCFRI